jgi:hypothetical protein
MLTSDLTTTSVSLQELPDSPSTGWVKEEAQE